MEFKAQFSDSYGTEAITIKLAPNGLDLTTIIRGVEFKGRSFTELAHIGAKDDTVRSQFSFCDRSPYFEDVLQQFKLSYNIPMELKHNNSTKTVILECHVQVPAYDAKDEEEKMKLALKYGHNQLESPGVDRGYEFELESLHSQLGADTYLRSCFSCRYSGYRPYFNSAMMGDLECFLDTPFQDDMVRGKGWVGWNHKLSNSVHVQEFHICQNYAK